MNLTNNERLTEHARLLRALGSFETLLVLQQIFQQEAKTVSELSQAIGVSEIWVRDRLQPLKEWGIVFSDMQQRYHVRSTWPLLTTILEAILLPENTPEVTLLEAQPNPFYRQSVGPDGRVNIEYVGPGKPHTVEDEQE